MSDKRTDRQTDRRQYHANLEQLIIFIGVLMGEGGERAYRPGRRVITGTWGIRHLTTFGGGKIAVGPRAPI